MASTDQFRTQGSGRESLEREMWNLNNQSSISEEHESRDRHPGVDEAHELSWILPASTDTQQDPKTVLSTSAAERTPSTSRNAADISSSRSESGLSHCDVHTTGLSTGDMPTGTLDEVPLMHAAPAISKTPERDLRKALRSSYLTDWWLWEMVGATVSIACIVAVVILALHLDQTSLSEWSFVLGPSTIISALITAIKSAMLLPIAEGMSQLKWLYFSLSKRPLSEITAFDDASRGPWGSLMFFSPQQLRVRPALGFCGAFLTISMLAMGPFAQQIVELKSRMVAQPGVNSSISISAVYDSGDEAVWRHVFNTENDPTSTDPRMQGAFFNGLFSLGTPFDLICQTGNCTWPDFASLAVCSTCEDVSSKAEVSFNTTPSESNVTFTTPSGFEFNMALAGFRGGGVEYTMVAGQARVSTSWMKALPTTRLVLAGVAQLGSTSMEDGGNWTVTECSLDWCAKVYKNFTVSDGEIQPYTTEDIALSPNPNETQDDTVDMYSSTLWRLTPNQTATSDHPPPPPLTPTTEFIVTNYDHISLASFLSTMFTFSLGSKTTAFTIGRALEYGVDAAAVVANISDSMTNVVRTSSRNATNADGVVWRPDTVVEIRWAWLALPLAVVLLGAAFLAAVLVVSRGRDGFPLWKSSLLPLLFHGLEEWDEGERRERREGLLERVSEMGRVAREMDVRVGVGGGRETRFLRGD